MTFLEIFTVVISFVGSLVLIVGSITLMLYISGKVSDFVSGLVPKSLEVLSFIVTFVIMVSIYASILIYVLFKVLS